MDFRWSADLGGRTTPPLSAKTGAQLRKQLMAVRDFDAAELVIVDVAVNAFNRAKKAARLVRRQGIVIEALRGSKEHPAISIQIAAECQMLRAFKALGL